MTFEWKAPPVPADHSGVDAGGFEYRVVKVDDLDLCYSNGWILEALFQEQKLHAAWSVQQSPYSGNNYGDRGKTGQYIDCDGLSVYVDQPPEGFINTKGVTVLTVLTTKALIRSRKADVDAISKARADAREAYSAKNARDVELKELQTKLESAQDASAKLKSRLEAMPEQLAKERSAVQESTNAHVLKHLGILGNDLENVVKKMWTRATNNSCLPEGFAFDAFKAALSSGDWATAFQIARGALVD